MRVPLVSGMDFDLGSTKITGSVCAGGVALWDLDEDGSEEVIVGTTEGSLIVVKPTSPTPWAVVTGLLTISAVSAGTVFGMRNVVLVCCLEGRCLVFAPMTRPSSTKGAVPVQSLDLRATFYVAPNFVAVCRLHCGHLVAGTLDRRLHVYQPVDNGGALSVEKHKEVSVPYQLFSVCESQCHGVVLLGTSLGWCAVVLATGAVHNVAVHTSRVPMTVDILGDYIAAVSEDGTVSLFRVTGQPTPNTFLEVPVSESGGVMCFERVWSVRLHDTQLVLRPSFVDCGERGIRVLVMAWGGEGSIINMDGHSVEFSVPEPVCSVIMSRCGVVAKDSRTATTSTNDSPNHKNGSEGYIGSTERQQLVVCTLDHVYVYPSVVSAAVRSQQAPNFMERLPTLLSEEQMDVLLSQANITSVDHQARSSEFMLFMRQLIHGS
eukprot:PhM_4_TR15513/c0_g1_i1/m.36540